MKKIILSLVALAAFGFVSCEEDNDNLNPYQGKWTPNEVIVNGVSAPYANHASCGNDYLMLNEFLSFEIKDFVDTEIFNTETGAVQNVCEEKVSNGSYRVSEGKISFYGAFLFSGGEVSVNGNEMRIKSFSDVDSDGTIDEVVTVFSK